MNNQPTSKQDPIEIHEITGRKTVTIDNCLNLSINEELIERGDIRSQAAAWRIVHDFCLQNGMKTGEVGIKNVIRFIDEARDKWQPKWIDELSNILKELESVYGIPYYEYKDSEAARKMAIKINNTRDMVANLLQTAPLEAIGLPVAPSIEERKGE